MHSKRIQEKVKHDYDTIADSFSKTRQGNWKDFDRFSPYLKKSAAVLDLGCGNGRLLGFLKPFGITDYLGIDQSKALLKEARQLHPQSEFLEADMSEPLPIKKSFDVIFAIASFHHLPPKDQLKTLRAWKKQLKPGGTLLMTNWNLHQPSFWPQLLKSFCLPRFGFRGVLVPWQGVLERYYFAFTKRRLSQLLKKAGFIVLVNDYIRDGESANLFNGKNILSIARYEPDGRPH